MNNIKKLHLENDALKELPSNFVNFKSLEYLYLNGNKFENIPLQIKGLPHLQYLELRQNNLNPQSIEQRNLNFGFKIEL